MHYHTVFVLIVLNKLLLTDRDKDFSRDQDWSFWSGPGLILNSYVCIYNIIDNTVYIHIFFYLKLILFIFFRFTFKFNINIVVAIGPK